MIPNHKDLRSQVSYSESASRKGEIRWTRPDGITTNVIPGLPSTEAKAGNEFSKDLKDP